MKRMLLILMVLASAAMADDAKMKAILVGSWLVDDETTYTFTSDGKWLEGDSKLPYFPNKSEEFLFKWDIKDGELIQIREPAASRPYTILFLTKHECLLHWTHHGGGYSLWTR